MRNRARYGLRPITSPHRLTVHPALGRPALVALLALLLASLVLGACAASTDIAATVGPDQITVGEFNAAVARLRAQLGEQRWAGNEQAARRYIMDSLVENRLTQLEAARKGITITDADVDQKMTSDIAALAAQLRTRETQTRDTLAASGAQQLRPLLNAHGGQTLADTDVQALVRAEIDQLQAALDARGQAFPGDVPASVVRDRAAALAGALASKGVTVTASDVEPTLGTIAAQLAAPHPSVADTIQQQLSTSGYASSSDYRLGLRQQLLDQKVLPLYIHQVNAITLQQLITDDKAKAQEALAKARAGANFADLVQQYALDAARGDQVVNNIGSVIPEFFPPDVKQLFPSLDVGAYSEVWTTPGPNGKPVYRFFKITKNETRDPTPDEAQSLRQQWLEGLRGRYPVYENPALNLPPHQTQ